jgi:hypothetical protein
MPPLDGWPADGYMLLAWLRLEEPARGADRGPDEDATSYGVLQFVSDDGASGWRLSLRGARLHLTLTARGQKQKELHMDHRFRSVSSPLLAV